MNIKSKFIKLLLCATLLIPGAAIVAPSTAAHAGQDYWSSESCAPNVYWYNYSGYYGTEYSWDHGPGIGWAQEWVGGGVMRAYSQMSWQCGWLGPPWSEENYNDYYQNFEYGYIYYNWTYGCWIPMHYNGLGYNGYQTCMSWGL